MKVRLAVLGLAGALMALASAGCATVEPWQRSKLANPHMIFDYNAAQVSFENHWQTAREGSAGGFGFQGGGCGCK